MRSRVEAQLTTRSQFPCQSQVCETGVDAKAARLVASEPKSGAREALGSWSRKRVVPLLSTRYSRKFRLVAATLWMAFGVVGCGNALYAIQANSASSKFEEARELGAEQYAPYEYYMAQEHLRKAETEAAEADYGDATELSNAAEEYADKAIVLSREAHRGAGR